MFVTSIYDDIRSAVIYRWLGRQVGYQPLDDGGKMKIVMLSLWLLLVANSGWAADNGALLLSAASLGQVQRVQDLISQGADANTKNGAGRPVLLVAAFNGNVRTLRVLIGAGADVNAVDGAGNTALMEAAAFGHQDAVAALIMAGADVNLKNGAGFSAMSRAALGKYESIKQLLTEAGAEGADEAK